MPEENMADGGKYFEEKTSVEPLGENQESQT